jgi:hypothetical protein
MTCRGKTEFSRHAALKGAGKRTQARKQHEVNGTSVLLGYSKLPYSRFDRGHRDCLAGQDDPAV